MKLCKNVYYAAVEGDYVPESSNWGEDLMDIKRDAMDLASHDPGEEVVVYRITLEPLYRTVVNVALEEF